PVLVGLGEDGRDDPLAEGVIDGVVDGRGGDRQPRGAVAVDGDIGRQALVLHVGADVAQFRLLLQGGDDVVRPGGDGGLVGTFQRELVLGAADLVVDGQVL